MKKRSLIILATLFAFFLLNSNVFAGYLDTGWLNITNFDNYKGGSSNPTYDEWWNTTNEDEEVEPGAATGQQWDLQGFFLSDGTDSNVKSNELAMVGGFNFETGQDGVALGDIFIDTDMDNDYYEYVLDLDFENKEYSVIQSTEEEGEIKYETPTISGPTVTKNVAWAYKSGGKLIYQDLALNYLSNTDLQQGYGGVGGVDAQGNLLPLEGTWHNVATVNLSFLGGNTNFQVLNTMQCGNDVQFAQGSTAAAVPEPATILLLGSGLLGLLGYRKKFWKPKT